MRQPPSGVAQDQIVTTLGSPGELQLTCTSLGASIVSLRMPVEDGVLETVLGYPDSTDYLHDAYYMGAMCGRYAGRIENARFRLNGAAYSISKAASDRHALHGGADGFNARQWSPVHADSTDSLAYRLHSPDGDQGFPGDLDVTVTYTLRENHQLVIDVEAHGSRDTVVNLVSHSYFNLNVSTDGVAAGSGSSKFVDQNSISNHTVTIFADAITELDDENIPTGELLKVADTPFDLRPDVTAAGQSSARSNQPLGSQVFDQNYVLNKRRGADTPELAAVVSVTEHPVALAVYTTLPGLQLYTGDYLDGLLAPRAGLCLEAQYFPDSPNQPSFPDAVLRAGEVYRSRTVYAFGALEDIIITS